MTTLFPPVSWTPGIEKEVYHVPRTLGARLEALRSPLPPNPNLDKQKKLAKALARDYWRSEAEAVERVRALHPKPPPPENFVLSDAQLVIARGYGFAGWPHMKRKIESLTKSPAELFKAAVEAGDVDHVRQLLQSHPVLVSKINEPMFGFGSSAVHVARTSLELLDLLLAHGADLNARTSWDKGGFGVLEQVDPDEAAPLIARGARIDVWAAANLGITAALAALIAGDPSLVHAKGGDGKRPLHFARTVEIARSLLDHGAEIDALDEDHDSTPAQHLIGDRPDVAGFLVTQGARSDLLLAAALGDLALVRRHLDADPSAIAMRVDQDWFPMIDTAPNGGHIYQWTLGFHVSAFDVARKRGHAEVLDLLLKRAGPPIDYLMRSGVATMHAPTRPRGRSAARGACAGKGFASGRRRRPQQQPRRRQSHAAPRVSSDGVVTARRIAVALGGVPRQRGHGGGRFEVQPANRCARLPIPRDRNGLAGPWRAEPVGVFDRATRRLRTPAARCGRPGGRGVTANRTRCHRSGAA